MNASTPQSWASFSRSAPELSAAVAARFLATKHHVIGTLRSDGAPRLSGTEVQFHDGRLAVGFMNGSVKANDLRIDPRCALHSNPGDGTMVGGDAKIGAVASEVTHAADPELFDSYVAAVEPPQPFHLFTLEVRDVTLTALHPAGDRMVITTWRPGRGLTTTERA